MRLYVGLFAIASFIIIIDALFYLIFLRQNKSRKIYFALTTLASISYVSFWVFLFTTSPKTYGYLEPDNYPMFFLAGAIMIVFYIPRMLSILIKALLWLPQILKLVKIKLVNMISLSLGAMVMLVSISGILIIRFQFRVIQQTIEHASIPASFDNYKIVQISDLHLGTAKNYKSEFTEMVNKINQLNPDIVVFTGDLVNNFATELEGWIPILRQVKAKYGIYAILGNHDYGDYVPWKTPQDKQRNFMDVVSFFDAVNWQLLRNHSTPLISGTDTIVLAGVENWGNPPFPRYGDLNQTVPNSMEHPVILLSHDPSHWDEEVIKHPANIFLTLSGHTHGFQFGIRSERINISPVSLKYEKWGGLYEHNNRYLYVNIGAGTIGFPGRIGMRPEITLLTLKHVNK